MGVRALVRAAGSVVAVGVVAVGVAMPAAAKGLTGVAIGHPGGELVDVSGEPTAMDGTLAEDLGLWATADTAAPLLAEAPTADLGPALVVEWTTYDDGFGPDGATPHVVQTVYPHASGGALVHTRAGQPIHGWSGLTLGGWSRAPQRLSATLAAIGIGPGLELPSPRPAPGPAAAAAADGSAAVGSQADGTAAASPEDGSDAAGSSSEDRSPEERPAGGRSGAAPTVPVAVAAGLAVLAGGEVVRRRRRRAGTAAA